MAEEQFSAKHLQQAPDLRGRFTKKDQSLTEEERAIAQFQGLIDPASGLLTDEAIAKPIPDVSANMPQVVPLEQLTENAADIQEQVEDIQGENADEAEISPDLQVEAPLTPPLAPPGYEEGTEGGSDYTDPDPLPTKAPSEDPADSSVVNIGALLAKSNDPFFCSHCGWDQRGAFQEPKHGEEDKMAFVRHIMSPAGRFYKEYNKFDGKMKVTLRSRSQWEADSIVDFARSIVTGGIDKTQSLTGMMDLTAQMQRYQMMASVHSITNLVDSKTVVFPTLESYKDDDSKEFPVKLMEKTLLGEGRSIGIINIMMASWLEFERLYGWLTSRAHEPDFWKAVGGSRS